MGWWNCCSKENYVEDRAKAPPPSQGNLEGRNVQHETSSSGSDSSSSSESSGRVQRLEEKVSRLRKEAKEAREREERAKKEAANAKKRAKRENPPSGYVQPSNKRNSYSGYGS